MLSINTNLSSLIVQNSLTQSTSKLNQSIERMSTGYKINHASDNAANYSISTNMTTKMSAYQVAEDNTEMGLDMVTSASETLSEMENYATRLRALATQAQNGTYGKQSLNAIQTEANALVDEIERLYSTAKYNGIKLLDTKPEIPEGIGLTKNIAPKHSGFIENPCDYTNIEVQNMTKLETIDENTTISSGKYSISNIKELVQLAKMVEKDKITGGEFVLANDIDLSEFTADEGWTPIKLWNKNCIFNGNGNSITGLIINCPTEEGVGFFKLNTGIIKNLCIEDCEIIGGNQTGALVGSSRYSTSLIENCYTTGTIIAERGCGGLVGYTYYSKVFNSYSEANVKASSWAGGGLVGEMDGGSIKDCFATGNIETGSTSGGLIGYAKGTIENCYAESLVSSRDAAGGLIGELNGTVINCYAEGNVTSNRFTGGFIGCTSGNVAIKNCYSIADVEGAQYAGSFIGSCSVTSESSVKNVYCYGATRFDNHSGGLIGRLINKSSVLNIENANMYSKLIFDNPNKSLGSFIAINQNTADGSVFGTLNISNSKVLAGQNIDKICGCYKLENGQFKLQSYDMTDMLAGIKDISEPKKSTSLQIGINNNENNKIEFNSKIERELLKKIRKLNLSDKNSTSVLDDFLLEITKKQTELGAVTNRLESALDEIAIQYDNLASSRSTLRDADMAKLSSQYIKMQILQQASATLLATANQSPNIALQLI